MTSVTLLACGKNEVRDPLQEEKKKCFACGLSITLVV